MYVLAHYQKSVLREKQHTRQLDKDQTRADEGFGSTEDKELRQPLLCCEVHMVMGNRRFQYAAMNAREEVQGHHRVGN